MKSCVTSLFGSLIKRDDEAIECYRQAANLYKMANEWSKAGSMLSVQPQIFTRKVTAMKDMMQPQVTLIASLSYKLSSESDKA